MTLRRKVTIALVVACMSASAFVPGLVVIPRFAPAEPCVARDAELVVNSASKTMWLCEAGRPTERFRVGLGRGGAGKRTHDDDKTPVGKYVLGSPHASTRLHVFIPVGYPTAEQRRLGFTGGDVGIHGPVRWMRWCPWGATWVNRTRGCIEVESTGAVERIASWVRAGRVRNIYLE